mmetsp:Transcript_22034/g.3659  ORF Transcript_22034/g.3659 Transcript_22034/m.3659 type:complete len:119 (+) Transcript_22034:268-624(+)
MPYFWDGACHSDCKPGTIDIDGSKICVNCNTTCKTCVNSVDQCASCNLNGSTPYLQANQCRSECSANSYETAEFVCEECNQLCKTCESSSDSCTSCNSPSKLYNNQCMETCPEKTLLV